MADFGTITLALDGEVIPIRGEVTFVNLSGGETTFEANMDGSVHEVFAPAVPMAEISSISGSAFSITQLVALMKSCDRFSAYFEMSGNCSQNVTTAHFIEARLGGALSLNASNGEISGVVIASDNVRLNDENA